MIQTGGTHDMEHPNSETLAEFAFGGLGGGERERVESHVRDCEQCSAEVGQYTAMSGMLAALPEYEPPRSFALSDFDVAAPRRSLLPAWLSLAASIVLALGMVGAIARSNSGGGASNSSAQYVSGAASSGGAGQSASESSAGAGGTASGVNSAAAGRGMSGMRVVPGSSGGAETGGSTSATSGSSMQASAGSSGTSASIGGSAGASVPKAAAGRSSHIVPALGVRPERTPTLPVPVQTIVNTSVATATTSAVIRPLNPSPTATSPSISPSGPVGGRSGARIEHPLPWILGVGSLASFLLFLFFLIRGRLHTGYR